MAVLKWSYTGEMQAADCFDVSAFEEPPAELSSLQELAAWLEETAERAASAEATGIEESLAPDMDDLPDAIPEEQLHARGFSVRGRWKERKLRVGGCYPS
eukprot:Skav222015  [mRNA]  locus=scaffold2020:339672:344735:- [translate_table: standard]